MKIRFLVVRAKCPFCRQMIKVVSKLNLMLPIDKRIQIIDAWEYEYFGLKDIPLMDKLEKDGLSEGFPLLICDGVRIEPAPTEEMLKILLKRYLNEDFLY